MDPRVRNQALPQGQVDAITGFINSIVPALGAENVGVRILPYKDYGQDMYGNSPITARGESLEKDPELCQGIVDGYMEALKFTELQPDAAQEMFLSALPELKLGANGAKFIHLGMGIQRAAFLASTDPVDHCVGWQDLARLSQMADLVMKYQADPGAQKPDIAKVFTNRFLGRVTISAEEWKSCQKQTEWVDALMHPKS
jgi:ABC-type nitrate/sulfonate/bicarbonate transport system substrate-binding protein